MLDGLLVVALAGVSLAYLSGVLPGMTRNPGLSWLSSGLTLLQTLPLLGRRRAPFGAWFLVVLGGAVWASLGYGETLAYLFAAPFALGSVAADGTPREARTAAVLTVVGIVVLVLGAGGNVFSAGVVLAAAMFATAWSIGDNLRRRRSYAAMLEERAVRLERAREEHARRLVLEERARLARELHDVVAHHVSMISVQAETGPYLLAAGEARAADGFASIGATARQALTEMRRLLGVLREETVTPADLAPQPGVGEIEELVAEVRRSGLPVELSIRGTPRPLPAGVDLSAYRIVQEALTNVRKHAGSARAVVLMAYDDDALRLRVVDDGSDAPPGDGAGQGLVGMRERVAMLGGHLRAGPDPSGGFAVAATLPLDQTPAGGPETARAT